MTIYQEDIIRLILAIVVGGVIGLERESRDKDAGFRTLILICAGSALFSLLSFRLTPINSDPTRILANIVTGVGFLGAGVILHRNNRSIRGVTTAATIWLVAALGMGIGSGQILLALTAAGIILFVLLTFPALETFINRFAESRSYEIITEFDLEFPVDLQNTFRKMGLFIQSVKIFRDGDHITCQVVTFGTQAKQNSALKLLLSDPRITRITY